MCIEVFGDGEVNGAAGKREGEGGGLRKGLSRE